MTVEAERFESDLQLATESNPRSIVAWSELAQYLEENRRRKDSAEAWTRAALLYMEENMIEQASNAVQRALSNKNADPEALRISGVLHRDHGFRLHAEKRLRRSLRLDPSSAQAWTDIGILYYEMEKYGDAEKALKEALSLGKGRLPTSQYYALVLADTSRLTQAISTMREAEGLAYDADYEFWFHLGVLLWKVGIPDEATKTLRRAVRSCYENNRLLPRVKKARKEIRKVVRKSPISYDALIKLGCIFEDAWQNDLAEWGYRLATRFNPEGLDAWILIHDVITSGRDAEEVLEKAYFIDSNHPDVLHRKAEEFYEFGMKREAVQTFHEARTKENAEYVDRRIEEIENEMMEYWGGYEPQYDYDDYGGY